MAFNTAPRPLFGTLDRLIKCAHLESFQPHLCDYIGAAYTSPTHHPVSPGAWAQHSSSSRLHYRHLDSLLHQHAQHQPSKTPHSATTARSPRTPQHTTFPSSPSFTVVLAALYASVKRVPSIATTPHTRAAESSVRAVDVDRDARQTTLPSCPRIQTGLPFRVRRQHRFAEYKLLSSSTVNWSVTLGRTQKGFVEPSAGRRGRSDQRNAKTVLRVGGSEEDSERAFGTGKSVTLLLYLVDRYTNHRSLGWACSGATRLTDSPFVRLIQSVRVVVADAVRKEGAEWGRPRDDRMLIRASKKLAVSTVLVDDNSIRTSRSNSLSVGGRVAPGCRCSGRCGKQSNGGKHV